MCFNMFGTRLQSLWIMFFFLLEWSEKPNAGHNPFETVTNFTFFFGMLPWQVSPQVFVKVFLALILAYWIRKDIHYSVFSSRLHLDFDCATFLDDFPCWWQKQRWDHWLHRNEAGALCRTTAVKHFSVHMVQASLRQMNVEGTEHTCAKL